MQVGEKYWLRFEYPVQFKYHRSQHYYDSVYKIEHWDLPNNTITIRPYTKLLGFYIIPARGTHTININSIEWHYRYG